MARITGTNIWAIVIFCCWVVFPYTTAIASNVNGYPGETGTGDISYTQSLQPLPAPAKVDPVKVNIGKQLFFDPVLSNYQGITCATCHNLTTGGDDNVRFAPDQTVNTPTIFNAIYNTSFTWNGKKEKLAHLFDMDITSKSVMRNDWITLVATLKKHKGYTDQFNKAFQNGVTRENILNSLVAFQQQLVTPDSRFDRFLKGDKNTLTLQEKNGFRLFNSYGCDSCHQGRNIGGNMFQKLGLFDNYFRNRQLRDQQLVMEKSDYGRFNVTGKEQDKFYFRVPSLRNVATTAPYLHDGNAKNLDEAIQIMGKYQLGRLIPEQDRQDIAAFLHSLTGQYQGQYLEDKSQ